MESPAVAEDFPFFLYLEARSKISSLLRLSLGHAAYFLQLFDAHFAAGFLAAVFLTVAFFAGAFFAGAFFAGAFFAGAFFVVAFFAIIWPPIRKKKICFQRAQHYLLFALYSWILSREKYETDHLV
jgi:hypothetical protein